LYVTLKREDRRRLGITSANKFAEYNIRLCDSSKLDHIRVYYIYFVLLSAFTIFVRMNNNRRTRVRFAPSPTGPLHIGGVRTALYNYLFAKQRGGDFLLRIEDTDSQRFVPGAEEYIIKSLEWCGISPNEGVSDGKIVESADVNNKFAPYRQSQRKSIYHKYAQELIEKGYAYYAFDTPEGLESKRREAESTGSAFIYNYAIRESMDNSLRLSKEETAARIAKNNNWVIRFKIPADRIVKISDMIRGDIEVNTSTLDDKVLWKAIDQLPTYHLANVVDDKLMEISDVIRGEEWLPSLPLHYLLYEAFGWNDIRPNFAHLSLLLKPDGKGKLSKRDGDRLGFPVFPLEWISSEGDISRGYREDGYLPDAFINMLAFLGWNPGTEQEIFTLEQLIDAFSIERVVKSGAQFNPEKARWFNQEYLKTKGSALLADYLLSSLKSKGIESDRDYVERVVELIRDRAVLLTDLWPLSDYLFIAPKQYDQKIKEKFWKEDTPFILRETTKLLSNIEPFTKDRIEEELHRHIKDNGFQMGSVMNCIRLALVGESKGPGVADIIALLGRDEAIRRILKLCSVI
jgi:glutamyl-tRNA synthetase, bacterial family